MLAFLIILPYTLSQSCPAFSCKPSTMTFSPNTCLYTQSPKVYLSPCPSTSFCPQVSQGNSTCTPIIPTPSSPSYPGEPCQTNSDCIYPQCINNICIGKHWLESCTNTSECHVGLYCDLNFVCWPQKNEHSRCENEFECQNSMGCNKWSFNDPGECRKYYSLTDKEWVYDCESYISSFCASGNCGGPGGKGICIDGIKPRYLNPVCETDEDCQGESFGWQYYSTCECGYDGVRYCKPFLGDYVGKLYVAQIAAWFGSEQILKCHTERRMSEVCMQNWSQYQSYLQALYLWKYYPQLQNNDDCVKKMFTDFYWKV